jgi:hypothetical protein
MYLYLIWIGNDQIGDEDRCLSTTLLEKGLVVIDFSSDHLVKCSSKLTSLIKCKSVVSWFDGFRRYADKRIDRRLTFDAEGQCF